MKERRSVEEKRLQATAGNFKRQRRKRDQKAEDDCDAEEGERDEVEGQIGEGADVEEDHDEDGDR